MTTSPTSNYRGGGHAIVAAGYDHNLMITGTVRSQSPTISTSITRR
jgi:hypothetical protein